jgi:hypothetical protein
LFKKQNNALKYAEAREIRIDVLDKCTINDLKLLIEIKIGNK